LNHFATPEFWSHYRALPDDVQRLADLAFDHMKADLRHPGVQLKQAGDFWSARVGLHYRALGVSVSDGISWFWIGTHAAYDRLVR
jgi:hypothetical protein